MVYSRPIAYLYHASQRSVETIHKLSVRTTTVDNVLLISTSREEESIVKVISISESILSKVFEVVNMLFDDLSKQLRQTLCKLFG